ncbi:unnamed protein product [Ceutorhynchus assimilis]|uniref:Prefoldin subunit 1 n=1 Tax=Ceutorhynchus assimilis TaxID=467358 RepID=A0A9N9QBC2_9CUCU|nr:unnamed protein product [Ceutorhynchus assimilis]
MSKVDLELKKAFVELQEKKLATEQNLRISKVQIENLKRSQQRAVITGREISTLKDTINTYESVGRMFVLTPKPIVEEKIKKIKSEADEKIKTLETQMTYWENSLKEATDVLRELVQSKK